MQNLPNTEIKKLFEKYFNYTVQNRPREFYIENIGYMMQELAFGGLPMKSRQLLEKLYTSDNSKSAKPRVAPTTNNNTGNNNDNQSAENSSGQSVQPNGADGDLQE